MGDDVKGYLANEVGPRQRIGFPEALDTDRRQLEIELQDAHERLQHVLAVCPAIIYTTKATGDDACTFVGENIEQILGYSQREMRNDPDFWTTHIRPHDARRVLAELFRLIPKRGGNLKYRFRHHDGLRFWR